MMTLIFLQTESLPDLTTFSIVAGVGVFLLLATAAYVVFRLTRRTVKTAIRLTIVAVILLIALVGSVAVYWKSGSTNQQTRPRPAPTRIR